MQHNLAEKTPHPDNLSFIDLHPIDNAGVAEILHGLQQPQKRVSPRYFYDQAGSQLFEDITLQPEYYPTRTERQLLQQYAGDIAACAGGNITLIEPGCGSCEKVRLLLDAVKPAHYIAMDISGRFLLNAASNLARETPWMNTTAVCADFSQLNDLAQHLPDSRRIAFYPGSTLGNFEPDAARQFLTAIRELVGPDGGLLIGVDREKDARTLNAAYNDAAGITEKFNLNVLDNLNRVLPADFSRENFRHYAFYNSSERRIEMHLESQRTHTVQCANATISLQRGETLHTEYSYKYSPARFEQLAKSAGFKVSKHWSDRDELFSLYFCTAG